MNGKTILVVFLLIGSVGLTAIYLNQRPVEKTIIVERIEAQPSAPATPAQVPAPTMAAHIEPPVAHALVPAPNPAPSTPVGLQLHASSVVFAPTPPACIKIEKQIRVAQQVINQLNTGVAAAQEDARKRFFRSQDYLTLKSQLEEKKQAKQDALNALQRDRQANADTDQDVINVRTTSADWINLSGTLTKMQNDAVSTDSAVRQKVQDLASAKADMVDLQKQLNSYITREIAPLCVDTSCRVNNIHLDPDKWALHVDITPTEQSNPSIAADIAFDCVGTVLETLHRSPFTWQTIDFKVYDPSEAVEFRLSYEHSAVAYTKFELTHELNLLYQPLFLPTLQVGATGVLIDANISQIIDEENMIVYLGDDLDTQKMPVWVRGVDTRNHVDNSNVDIDVPLKIVGTIRYETVLGGSRTVFLLEPTGFKQNLVIGNYFDPGKLINLAENVWLNPKIDQLQGRPPIPDTYIPHPGMEPPRLVNTLDVGGYTRADGSNCPLFVLHTLHPIHAAQQDAPIVRAAPLPSGSTNYNPMIVNQPPPAGF